MLVPDVNITLQVHVEEFEDKIELLICMHNFQ